jgi:hypothetical protein
MQVVHSTQRHAKPLRNVTPPKQALRSRWRRPVRVLPLESLDYSISLRCANGGIHQKHCTNRLKSCIEHTASNTTGPAISHHWPLNFFCETDRRLVAVRCTAHPRHHSPGPTFIRIHLQHVPGPIGIMLEGRQRSVSAPAWFSPTPPATQATRL